MNSTDLLAMYERVADTPDAVEKLRAFVLELAMRGRLVSQSPVIPDSPINSGSFVEPQGTAASAVRALAEADMVAKPYMLPSGWRWVRFGTLHHLVRGVTYSKADASDEHAPGYVPVLRANNIGVSLSHVDPVFVRKERVSSEQFLRKGDFLIALSSGSKNLVGKAAYVEDDFNEAFGGFCGVIRMKDMALVPFTYCFLRSGLYRQSIAAGSRGIGINNLKMSVIADLPFPLPPIEEQRRIVTSVDELMALCDQLEAARKEREAARDRLATATLARLNTPNPDSFVADARFAIKVMPALTSRADQIKQLRQAILSLAVRGQLLPHVHTSAAIQGEEDPRVGRGECLLSGAAPDVGPAERSSREGLPRGWGVVRLSDLSTRIHYGYTASADTSITDVRMLRITDIQENGVDWDHVPGCEIDSAKVSQYQLGEGDILIARTGGTIGKSFLVDTVPVVSVFASYLIRVQPNGRALPRYMKLFLDSPLYWDQIAAESRGTGQPNVNGQALGALNVPLPPLAEQEHIVVAVDCLMALCQQLEESLSLADETRGRLLDTLLRNALDSARQ